MATKTVRLDEEAYERLRSRKRDGESFSDTVKRLAGERSLCEVAGIWAGETSEIREAVAETRSETEDRLDRIAADIETDDGNDANEP
jgi:predicted CopG family antitoxin